LLRPLVESTNFCSQTPQVLILRRSLIVTSPGQLSTSAILATVVANGMFFPDQNAQIA
jgi:hypothetical protein